MIFLTLQPILSLTMDACLSGCQLPTMKTRKSQCPHILTWRWLWSVLNPSTSVSCSWSTVCSLCKADICQGQGDLSLIADSPTHKCHNQPSRPMQTDKSSSWRGHQQTSSTHFDVDISKSSRQTNKTSFKRLRSTPIKDLLCSRLICDMLLQKQIPNTYVTRNGVHACSSCCYNTTFIAPCIHIYVFVIVSSAPIPSQKRSW
jgi:hypothetical protein